MSRTIKFGSLVLACACLSGQVHAQSATGRVTDTRTKLGVAGARVSAQDGHLATTTDSAGFWRLSPFSQDSLIVHVELRGYAPRSLVVFQRDRQNVTISLERVATTLDAVVVTASRREQRLSDAVVETSVIDATRLRQSGASDLAQILAEQSGLQLDGGVPTGAGVQVRGFDSRRVLVLLDGAPLVGRVGGNFDLSRLPVSMAERVEIVKGPQSTLYGNEALGGVVNIITRRASLEGWSLGMNTSAGSHGRLEGSVDGLWRRTNKGVSFDAGMRSIDLTPGFSSENATYARRGNGQISADWDINSTTRLSSNLLGVLESQRYRTGQLYRFSDNTQWAARIAGEKQTGAASRLSLSLHGSGFEHLSRGSTQSSPVSDAGDIDRQTLYIGEVLWNAVAGSVLIDAGAQARSEHISADRVEGKKRDIAGIEPFVQASVPFGNVTMVPGVRVSWSDRWGRFVAPRLATMWRPVESLAFRASVGRGYRAPDFKELYMDFVNASAGYAVRGNEDLQPERSTAYSVSAEYSGRRLWNRVSLYQNNYRDFIETSEPDAAGTYVYQNLDKGWIRGLEIESGLALGSVNLDVGADFLRSRDNASGTSLLGRPDYSFRAALGVPILSETRATASMVYTGSTPINRDPVTLETLERGGWARVDLRATRQLPYGFRFSLGVDNLFDKRMGDMWPGFTGRQFHSSLEWRTTGG